MCGEALHRDSQCTNPSKYINCTGNHSSNSKKCPIFLKENDIQDLRVQEGPSFPEARKRYEERCTKVTQPLLSAVAEKGINIATQTSSSLVSPTTSQSSASKKVNACAQTDVVAQTEAVSGTEVRPYQAPAWAWERPNQPRGQRPSRLTSSGIHRPHSRSRSCPRKQASPSPTTHASSIIRREYSDSCTVSATSYLRGGTHRVHNSADSSFCDFLAPELVVGELRNYSWQIWQLNRTVTKTGVYQEKYNITNQK
jgi:hypothetical protein